MTKQFYLNTTNILSLPLEDLKKLDGSLQSFIVEGYSPLFAELEELFYENAEFTIENDRVQELANKIEQFLQALSPELIKETKNLDKEIGSKNSDALKHLAFTLQALKNNKTLNEVIKGYEFQNNKRDGLNQRFLGQFFKDFARNKVQVINEKGKVIDDDIFGSIAKYHKLNEQIYKLRSAKEDSRTLGSEEQSNIIRELREITKDASHFSSFFPEISKENLQHINFIINALEHNKPLEYILQGDTKNKGIATIFTALLNEPQAKDQFYLDSLKTKLNLSNAQLNVIVSRFNQKNITGSEVAFGSESVKYGTSKNIFYVQTKNNEHSLKKIEHTATGQKIAKDKNDLHGNPLTIQHQKVSYTIDVTNLKECKTSFLPTQQTKEYISCEALNKNDIYQVPKEIEALLFDKQQREYIKKIVQTLASKPEAFKSILDLTQNPLAIASTIGNLEGTRYELMSLMSNSSKDKPILALLLENGLLEELTSLKADQVNNILIEIFKHDFIKTELSKAGIKDSAALIENLNLVINLTSTLKDHPIVSQLGSTLSKIITTKAKINASKGAEEKQALSHLQEQNIDTLKNIALNILALKETRQAATTLIRSSLDTLADIVDNNNFTRDKKDAIISCQTLDKRIAKETNIKLQDNLTKERKALAAKYKITPVDELTLSVTQGLGLNNKVNLNSLVPGIDPLIKSVINHPTELSNIIRSADKIRNAFKPTADPTEIAPLDLVSLINSGMDLLNKKDILKALFNKEFSTNYNKLDSSTDPSQAKTLLNYAKIGITLVAQEPVLSAIANNEDKIKRIIEVALPSELTEQEKKDIQIPSKPSTFLGNINETIKTTLTSARTTEQKNAVLEEIEKQEKALKRNKDLALEATELFCMHKQYFVNIASAAINEANTEKTLESFLTYKKTPKEKNTQALKTLLDNSLSLINSSKVQQAILTGLDEVIDSAYQKPNLKKELNFLKEDCNLVKNTLLQDIMPALLTYAKQAGNNNQIINLLAEAKDIIKKPSDNNEKPEVDLTKLKSVTKQAIQLYAKSSQNSRELTTTIEDNAIPLSNLIDKSLSLLNKNKLSLKLLKPLGINGDFVKQMLVKVNTEEGLTAIDKCIEEQSISNILGVLSATKSRSFILGHVTKSLVSYMFSPKNKEKNWTTSVQKDHNNNNEKAQLT